jgi:FkbM family methyltransferase
MIDDIVSLEMSLPGNGDPICFFFRSGERLDYIASFVNTYGLSTYEAPTPIIFAGLTRQLSGLILDVGANTGIFTLLAAASSSTAHVCAFEPLDTARHLLVANISCNPNIRSRILVEPTALSRTRGIMPFFETINDQGLVSTSSSLERAHAISVGNHLVREIATTTIDDWATRHAEHPIRLIKIDVEGHEHAVIEGARLTIRQQRPLIIVEILGAADFNSLNALLATDDYCDFPLSPERIGRCTDICFHANAWNHLLCPAECVPLVSMVCRNLSLCFE